MARWYGMAVVAAVMVATPAPAKAPKLNLNALLANASDNALTKLEQPGAFYADKAIRIMLPGPAKQLTGVLKFANKLGVGGDINKALNDAASLAAGTAKPVFRNAITQMSFTDGVGIIAKGGRSATDYLQTSSGSVLETQLRPLVLDAMGKTGVFKLFDKLGKTPGFSALGLTPDSLTDSVTHQTASGIFLYMGNEEVKLRRNPLKILGL